MEARRPNPALDPINSELTKITLIPVFKASCPRIWKLSETIEDIYAVLGTKGLTYFDVPIRYLQNFLHRYETELKDNTDVANVLLSETLDTVEYFIDSLRKMAIEAPERPKAPQEQPKSWNPLKMFRSSVVSEPEKPAPACTIEENGMKSVIQPFYRCETCKLVQPKMICKECAGKCHAGHKVTYGGNGPGYCDCRYETTLCQLEEACTLNYSGKTPIAQQVFWCETCKMDPAGGEMACHYCSKTCHKGHQVHYGGMTSAGFCDCKDMFKFCQQNKPQGKLK